MCFFLHDPATPEIYTYGHTLLLHDALPIYAGPARLKFRKSDRSEELAVQEIVRRLAMAHPDIAFTLQQDGRMAFRAGAIAPDLMQAGLEARRLARLEQILGRDFADNALPIEATREGIRQIGRAHV